jgi:hypothetical protein
MIRRSLNRFALAYLVFAPFAGYSASVVPTIEVAAIQQNRVADLVMLSHGYDAGLRQGMVCRVIRGQAEVAEVILVDLRLQTSVALILKVSANESIRARDVIAPKVFKS